MNALEVVRLAAQHGINLTVDGDKLLAKPLPTSHGMPAELVTMIRANKAEIVSILLEPLPHGDCARCGGDTENILTTATGESWMCASCWEDRHGVRWVAV